MASTIYARHQHALIMEMHLRVLGLTNGADAQNFA